MNFSHLEFPEGPLLLACSGGPDSTALAVLVRDVSTSRSGTHLVHINHRLRGRESEADARFVRDLGRQLGFPVLVAVRAVSRQSGNIEEKAREARYAVFQRLARRIGARAILTAHTLDDQVETVLMNVLRGASVDGLGGIPTVRRDHRDDIPVVRPFLNASKNEILRFLKARRISFRTDRSNRNPDFLRNWLRLKIVPALEKRNPGMSLRVARLAEIASAERRYWDLETDRISKRVGTTSKEGVVLNSRQLFRLPLAVQRRVLRRIAGRDLLTFEAVENLRRWLAKPPSNARIWQLKGGWTVERLPRSISGAGASNFRFSRRLSSGFRRKKDVSQS